jgi:mannose-6-phosphate isomerase-like protein (cupin superfamily)
MIVTNRSHIDCFVGDDGAIIRELASPHNSRLSRHSFAEIRHPPGTASREHRHTEAEEVYYVLEGQGCVCGRRDPRHRAGRRGRHRP